MDELLHEVFLGPVEQHLGLGLLAGHLDRLLVPAVYLLVGPLYEWEIVVA